MWRGQILKVELLKFWGGSLIELISRVNRWWCVGWEESLKTYSATKQWFFQKVVKRRMYVQITGELVYCASGKMYGMSLIGRVIKKTVLRIEQELEGKFERVVVVLITFSH